VALSSVRAATTMTADGALVPDRALDQSRMLPPTSGTQGTAVTPYGTALPQATEEVQEEGDFGKQVVLKPQEPTREFSVTGDVSVFGTSNAALTEHDRSADVFFVSNATVNWTHAINQQLQFQAGGYAALFRYNERSDLDFESLGGGLGLAWSPEFAHGIGFFARYDATQLLTRGGDDLLTEHLFTAGAVKVIVLSRAQALSFSAVGGLGITDPHSSQRDLIGAGMAYHLRLSRNLDFDAGYRGTAYFYNTHGRNDFNSVVSLSLRYHLTPWATVSIYGSFADNQSNHSGFDYDAWVGGGGVGLTWQF
jgi:hypothetical protein